MECAHPKPSGEVFANYGCYPFAHFIGCLLREGQGNDSIRIRPVGEDVRNPAGENPRFSASRSRYYQRRAIDASYSLILSTVQTFKNLFFLFHHNAKIQSRFAKTKPETYYCLSRNIITFAGHLELIR